MPRFTEELGVDLFELELGTWEPVLEGYFKMANALYLEENEDAE
jgi:hypothetical protein